MIRQTKLSLSPENLGEKKTCEKDVICSSGSDFLTVHNFFWSADCKDLLATFKSALCANLVFMSTEHSPVRTENLLTSPSSLYYDFCSFSNDVFFFPLLKLWLATNNAERQQNKNYERPEFCLLELFNSLITRITKEDPSGALNLYIHSQIYSERFSQLFSLSLKCADISPPTNL